MISLCEQYSITYKNDDDIDDSHGKSDGSNIHDNNDDNDDHDG